MGQIFNTEKIGTLSESGGTITLAPSILTIGGQQISTSSLNVAANLGAANTRYQVYAVRSGLVVSLVVSTNENSVGPAGYTSWKLVGSYTTNSTPAVGSISKATNEGRIPSTIMKIEYKGNIGETVAADTENLAFTTKVIDTHNAFNGTTFTAFDDMTIFVSGMIRCTTATTRTIGAYIDGNLSKIISDNTGSGVVRHFAGTVTLSKGDVFSIRMDVTSTLSNIPSNYNIAITQVPDSQDLGDL